MTERNSLAIRRRILAEFWIVEERIATHNYLWRAKSFEIYLKLSEIFGDNFMDYPEFEFWFLRFFQGNFDLNHDFSLEPETRVFTDLPVEIFEKVGDSLNLNDRFALRKVSKDIQERVDSWTPRVTDIDFCGCWKIIESFTPSQQVECIQKNNENVMSLLKNPKLRLDTLTLFWVTDKSKNLFRILERNCFNHEIHVKKFNIQNHICMKPNVLNMLDLGALDEVSLHITQQSVGKLNEFLSSEHLNGIKMLSISTFLSPSEFPLRCFQNHPRLTVRFNGGEPERGLSDFIKNLMNSTQLQLCHLSGIQFRLNMELIIREFQSPETMVSDFPDLRRYPIHGSDEFYEIEFNRSDDDIDGYIRIERMQ